MDRKRTFDIMNETYSVVSDKKQRHIPDIAVDILTYYNDINVYTCEFKYHNYVIKQVDISYYIVEHNIHAVTGYVPTTIQYLFNDIEYRLIRQFNHNNELDNETILHHIYLYH